jgi:chloramphenicol O-acetyltransferase
MIAYEIILRYFKEFKFIEWCSNLTIFFRYTQGGVIYYKDRNDIAFTVLTYDAPRFCWMSNEETFFNQAIDGLKSYESVKSPKIRSDENRAALYFYNPPDFECNFLYSDYESDKPIRQEIQARIHALYTVYETTIAGAIK